MWEERRREGQGEFGGCRDPPLTNGLQAPSLMLRLAWRMGGKRGRFGG